MPLALSEPARYLLAGPRPTRCYPFDPRLSMSDDRDRDMMTSHLEKRPGTPHSASPAHALQHARLIDTLPRLISPSLLTILVPSTGREPPDQRLQEQCWRQSRYSSISRTPEGRTRSTDDMPTISPFAFSDGHSDEPHENVSERFASRTWQIPE